jgi:hypothetical protein
MEAQWESKTPSNAAELHSQSNLIRDRIQMHQNNSPRAVLESLDCLTKGAAIMMHQAVLRRDRVTSLQKANEAATGVESVKRRIQRQGTLTKEEGSQIAARKNSEQAQSKMQQNGMRSGGNMQCCRRCDKRGHNARTCKKDAESAAD